MASGYGRYTGDPSAKKPKVKRTLAESLTNQGGLGGAYNSSSKPKKTDRYATKPINPTQGARHQSGVPKAKMASNGYVLPSQHGDMPGMRQRDAQNAKWRKQPAPYGRNEDTGYPYPKPQKKPKVRRKTSDGWIG
jgi:hypothetical protein